MLFSVTGWRLDSRAGNAVSIAKKGKQAVQASGRLVQKAASSGKPLPSKRAWAFRLVLCLTPILFLVLAEVAMRSAKFGYSVSFLLPAQFAAEKVWVQNDRVTWRFFGPTLARQPFPTRIPVNKPPNTIRVFVFGESAAYGDPQPEFGLTRLLQALLEHHYPSNHIEVVNAAMTAINSHSILPIARSCTAAEADVWVLYMGNNEVVGPFGAGTVFGRQNASLPAIRASLSVKTTRLGQLLDAFLRWTQSKSGKNLEWGGMQMFMQNLVRSDDPRMTRVYRNFERNLADLLNAGKSKGVKIVVSTVASNIKDCAPFASVHRRGLGADQLKEFEHDFLQGAASQVAGRIQEALDFFRSGERIDPTFADLQFRLGQCLQALGQDADAAKCFEVARDEDALRFRANTRINEIIRKGAMGREAEGIRLVDAAREFAVRSTNSICGREFLYEHVHLNFEGNYLLALGVAEQISKMLPNANPSFEGHPTNSAWPSVEQCASRLGWSAFAEQRGLSSILKRLTDPPFTSQSNQPEEYAAAVRSLQKLSSANSPQGLRDAEQRCQEAISRFPQDWVLHQELARVKQQMGDSEHATESWRTVVQFLPSYADGWQMLGECSANSGKTAEARDAFQEVLKLDSANVNARCSIADIYALEGRQAEATREYERALKQKPYWQPAHLGLGKVLEATGRKAEAEVHYRQALETRLRTPAALLALAKLCYERGWLSEAATNFSDALALDPLNPVAQANLGYTLSRLGRRAEARQAYEDAVRLDPNLAEARVRLGVELGREGRDSDALEQFAAAVKTRPELLEARINLGIAMLKAQRPAEAMEQFQEVLRLDPNNSTALKYVQRSKLE